jgi:hypothetical protein
VTTFQSTFDQSADGVTGQEALEAVAESESKIAQIREDLLAVWAAVGLTAEEERAYDIARTQVYNDAAALKLSMRQAGVPYSALPPAIMARSLKDTTRATATGRAVALGLLPLGADGGVSGGWGPERVVFLGGFAGDVALIAAYGPIWPFALGLVSGSEESGLLSEVQAWRDWLLVVIRGGVGRDVITSRNELEDLRLRVEALRVCAESGNCDPAALPALLGAFTRGQHSSEAWSAATGLLVVGGLALVLVAGAAIYLEVSSGGAGGKAFKAATAK